MPLRNGGGSLHAAAVISLGVTVAACSGAPETTAERQSRTIYGSDSRREYFEVESEGEKSIASGAMVALVSNRVLESTHGVLNNATSWGEVDHLCPDELFADQPSVAFCSGVLVDWDLVLSAGHCARALPVEDFSVVFDFYYDSPGKLAYSPDSTVSVTAIAAERLDALNSDDQLDYAWFRLSRPVFSPRQPIPVHKASSNLHEGDSLIVMGNGSGIPLKIDRDAKVRNVRGAQDYFSADADDFSGSSGGAALDEQLALTGIVSRGQQDLQTTDVGCQSAVRITTDDSDPNQFEDFTFASRAVQGLCRADPTASSLCRTDCADPCLAVPLPSYRAAGGCSLAPAPQRSPLPVLSGFLFILGWARRRRPHSNRPADSGLHVANSIRLRPVSIPEAIHDQWASSCHRNVFASAPDRCPGGLPGSRS